jgi:hypothetical protein
MRPVADALQRFASFMLKVAENSAHTSNNVSRPPGRSEKGSKAFFFEKRTKKLLRVRARYSPRGRSQMNKSFLLLFFKKEGLALPYSFCPEEAAAITCHDCARRAMIAAP